jgi:kumamolisin
MSLVPLPDSERDPLADFEESGPLDLTRPAEVTLVLRRLEDLPAGTAVSPEDLAARHGASAEDIAQVTASLGPFNLTVSYTHAASRRIKVTGTLADLAAAFGTELRQVRSRSLHGPGWITHRYREGGLSVPAELDGVITAVLGMDTRPQARPHIVPAAKAPHAAGGTTYTPAQVAAIYGYPEASTGSGQTVAVIELGGGFTETDLAAALPAPVPSVTAVSVDGGSNAPGSDPQGADVEVALDLQCIAGAAPGAAQVVYFAPNTDQGFIDAIADATHATPTPCAISVSWGQAEADWTGASLTAMDQAIADAAALGIVVCVAAGDNGSSDGVNDGANHVDFPASSPSALGCGGTTLVADPSTGQITSETVWNEMANGDGAGGGGVSDEFDLPAWQATAVGAPASPAPPPTGTSPAPPTGTEPNPPTGTSPAPPPVHHRRRHHRRRHRMTAAAVSGPGRHVPDIAGCADPATGYSVTSDGQQITVGGTSAVAPLAAGLVARLAGITGKLIGPVHPAIYKSAAPGQATPGFRDITSGNNGAFSAGPGYDCCTGLGSPDGAALTTVLS